MGIDVGKLSWLHVIGVLTWGKGVVSESCVHAAVSGLGAGWAHGA